MEKNDPIRIGCGTFWYWNSDPAPGGIRRQLKSMKDAGYDCVYIHPMPDSFHKYNFFQGMKIPYLGEKYFQLVKLALAECKKLGLYMMLYDEAGWPSGGVLDRLVKEHPDCRARFLTKGKDGTLSEITEAFPDLLSPRAAECFLAMVHERYYRELGSEFGKTIRGIFTDEPFWCCFPGEEKVRITDEMPGMFRTLYNCSFEKDILPFIFADAPDTPERLNARRKYIHVCSLLLKKNYSAPVAQWCENHGLALEGHFDNEDRFISAGSHGEIIQFLDPLHVPGVDAIWRQIYPGTGSGSYVRLAAAAAIRGKRSQALCECFNVYGYFLTPEVMAFVANTLISQGINRILPMPYLYSDRGRRKICCSTDISPRNPIWNAMPALNRFWNWAGNYNTGAMDPDVWFLAYPKFPGPQPLWTLPQKNLDAAQETEKIIDHLNDNCVFWRFADLDDLAGEHLPKALVLPCPLTDAEHQAAVSAIAAKGVKILNGWEMPDVKEYSSIRTVGRNRCRILPCLRPEGEALIVFNPAAEPRTFKFAPAEKWGELLPPDPVLQEFMPMQENNGIYELAMPPFALRILQKGLHSAPAVKLTPADAAIKWQISKVEKMNYSLFGWSRYKRCTPPGKMPENGLYTAIDKDFSGVVTCKGTFLSPRAGTAFIEFGKICHSGSLRVNGKNAGLRAFAPWVFKVDLRKGKNTLELAVASSGGNEWRRCFREELEPAGFFNVYAARLKEYTIDDHDCGITGSVKIYFSDSSKE